MSIAVLVFILSILGIGGVFGLKYWEEKTRHVVAPSARARADEKAIELKKQLGRTRVELQKLPPVLLNYSRVLVHEAALGAAASARFLERQAHRLADLVSHKHRFERREPRSEFLKQMTDHKNGNGLNGVDTTQ